MSSWSLPIFSSATQLDSNDSQSLISAKIASTLEILISSQKYSSFPSLPSPQGGILGPFVPGFLWTFLLSNICVGLLVKLAMKVCEGYLVNLSPASLHLAFAHVCFREQRTCNCILRGRSAKCRDLSQTCSSSFVRSRWILTCSNAKIGKLWKVSILVI